MAKQQGRSRSRSSNGRNNGRTEYPDYELTSPDEIESDPDVMLDVPVVKVDEIDLEVDDLRAAVSVRAELRQLVQLNVGVAASLVLFEVMRQRAGADRGSGIGDRESGVGTRDSRRGRPEW